LLLRIVSYYRKKRFEKKKIAVKLEMSVYCFMLDMRLVMKTAFSVRRLVVVLAARDLYVRGLRGCSGWRKVSESNRHLQRDMIYG